MYACVSMTSRIESAMELDTIRETLCESLFVDSCSLAVVRARTSVIESQQHADLHLITLHRR